MCMYLCMCVCVGVFPCFNISLHSGFLNICYELRCITLVKLQRKFASIKDPLSFMNNRDVRSIAHNKQVFVVFFLRFHAKLLIAQFPTGNASENLQSYGKCYRILWNNLYKRVVHPRGYS